MKVARKDQRKVTLRYLHDGITGVTTLTVDVEVPEDDMPHEHREELREMAEALLGVPLGSLPEDIRVRLRRPGGHGHSHPHPETPEAPGTDAAPRAEDTSGGTSHGPAAIKR